MYRIQSTLAPIAVLILICLAFPTRWAYGAQEGLEGFEDRRVMTSYRLQPGESIDLDGALNESFWERVEPATDFVQVEPDNGVPSTELTEVHIVYTHRF